MTTSCSSSSFPSPLPSALSYSPADSDLDATLETITAAKTAIRQWQEALDAALDHLTTMVESGEADPRCIWNDYSITQQRRITYTFPDDHPIKEQEKALRTTRDLAIAFGEAKKRETIFWQVKAL